MRKRCKRTVRVPVNPIEFAIEGARVPDQKRLDSVRLLELSAIDAFCTGTAALADWHTVTNMMNVCETMARGGVGPEAIPTCEAAQAELLTAAKRYEATQRMGLTGPGIQLMRDVFAYHDLQRQCISLRQYGEFIRRTHFAVQNKNAGVVEVN